MNAKKKIAPIKSLATHPYFKHQKQPDDARLERILGRPLFYVAVHEAAHAVVALALGQRVESITIAWPLPCVRYGDNGSCTIFELTVMHAAGIVIDTEFGERAWGVKRGDESDTATVLQMFDAGMGRDMWGTRESLVWLNTMCRAARIALSENGFALDRLTRALLREPSRTLTGGAIARAAGAVIRLDWRALLSEAVPEAA